jgi:outer membrane protein TolC
MFIPKNWGVIVLVLVFSSASFAQTQPLTPLIQNAIAKHPSIMAAQAQKNALLNSVDQSQVGFNPALEMNVGHKNDGSGSGMTLETTLKQTLLYPGKLESRKALAMSNVSLQEIEIQKLKITLSNDIMIKVFEWHSAVQKLDLNQKRFQKLNWIKTYLTSRPLVSPQKRLESRLIESHLKTFQMESLHLETLVKTRRLALETVVQSPVPDTVDWPEISKIRLQKTTILTQNPEIQALNTRVSQLALETQNLEMDSKTDFDLLGRYASESASGTDQFLSIGIGLELPFSNKNRFAIQAQDHKRKALEQQLIQLTKEKEAQWQTVQIELEQSQAVLSLYSPTWISELETSLNQAIDGFKKGQTELLSVLELESKWNAAANTRYDAQLESITAYSTLRQLLGQTEFLGDSL